MASDIELSGETVALKGALVTVEGAIAVGVPGASRPVHVATGEIHSGGEAGGFSFTSRSSADKGDFPEDLGDRFVLYADKGVARLWASGGIEDVFSVRWNGQVFVGGAAAGYSFGDQQGTSQFVQDAKNGERWTWFAKDKVARLRSNVDLLTVTLDARLGVNVGTPLCQLHLEGSEAHSGGAGGGWSFTDRSVKTYVAGPTAGERWVWYADRKRARLWSGDDKLTVSADGIVGVGLIRIGDGKIIVPTGRAPRPVRDPNERRALIDTMDLVAAVVALQDEVARLQAQIKALGGR